MPFTFGAVGSAAIGVASALIRLLLTRGAPIASAELGAVMRPAG